MAIYLKVGSFKVAITAHHELESSIREFFMPLAGIKPVKTPDITMTVDKRSDKVYIRCGGKEGELIQPELYLLYLKWKIYEQIVLRLNNFVRFHCGAVMKNKTVLLFPGDYGHGKTTICLFLLQHGFEILNDDAAIIHPKTHDFYILPKVIFARPSGLKRLNAVGKIHTKEAFKSGGKFLIDGLIEPRKSGPIKIDSYKCVFLKKKMKGAAVIESMSVFNGWKALDKNLRFMPETEDPYIDYLSLIEKIRFYKLSFSAPQQTLKYFQNLTG